MRRFALISLLVGTALMPPAVWLSFAGMHMPQPINAMARFILTPMLLLDIVGSKDPLQQPSEIALWVVLLVSELLWFWFWTMVIMLALRWWRRRGDHISR